MRSQMSFSGSGRAGPARSQFSGFSGESGGGEGRGGARDRGSGCILLSFAVKASSAGQTRAGSVREQPVK